MKRVLNIDFIIESENEEEFLEAIEELNEEGIATKSEVLLNEEFDG